MLAARAELVYPRVPTGSSQTGQQAYMYSKDSVSSLGPRQLVYAETITYTGQMAPRSPLDKIQRACRWNLEDTQKVGLGEGGRTKRQLNKQTLSLTPECLQVLSSQTEQQAYIKTQFHRLVPDGLFIQRQSHILLDGTQKALRQNLELDTYKWHLEGIQC